MVGMHIKHTSILLTSEVMRYFWILDNTVATKYKYNTRGFCKVFYELTGCIRFILKS
jgi:hypothetical protein